MYRQGLILGIFLAPTFATKIGIAYRTQIIHNLRGNVGFFNLGLTPNISTKLKDPANIIASISQDINYQFTVLGELGWANWSSMVDTVVTVRDFSAATTRKIGMTRIAWV